MRAQVNERRAVGQVIDDQVMHATREQHLAAVRDRPQPGAAVQRDPEVIPFVTELRLGRVQRDPHAHIDGLGPRSAAQLSLSL
jgi:hypothetical protein